MRILVDASPVGEGRGGLVTYVRELLRAWAAAEFDDELLVVGTRSLSQEVDRAVGHRGAVVRLGRRHRGARFAVQHVALPLRARSWRPDIVLATTPVVPPMLAGCPVVSVLHDLRYLRRPHEFGRLQRWYRRFMYQAGLRQATKVLAISAATQGDALAAYPWLEPKIEVVYLGADHFKHGGASIRGSHGVAFAHWPNKQPEISIRTWGVLRSRVDGFANMLHIVGVSTADRTALAASATECGVGDLVQLHEYLEDDAYRHLLSTARLVLMPSTFEGFGLPIIEAMRLGVAVVASDDPAMVEAGGPSALYAPAHEPHLLADECARVLFDDELHQSLLVAGFRRAATFTWRRTAEETRAVLARAATGREAIGRRYVGR